MSSFTNTYLKFSLWNISWSVTAGLLAIHNFNFPSNAKLISTWLNPLRYHHLSCIQLLSALWPPYLDLIVTVTWLTGVQWNSSAFRFSVVISVGEECSIPTLAIYIFLKFLLQSLVHFFTGLSVFFPIDMLEFFISSEYNCFWGHVSCRYFLFFTLLTVGSVWWTDS